MVKTVCAAYPKGLKMRTVTDGGAIRKERRKFNSWITRLDVDVLRALASLPYGDDGELKISSLAEAVDDDFNMCYERTSSGTRHR